MGQYLEGSNAPAPAADLARRHRLMGAGAELFLREAFASGARRAGVWLYDPRGQAYLDVYNNVPHVGHAHPAVVSAVQRQTAILATHTRYLHENILEYAEQITARLPKHLDACIFVNSGSEANDVAWRMARMASGHEGGLVMDTAYHGITDAVAALTLGAGRPQDARVAIIAPPPARLRAADTMTPAELNDTRQDADRAIAALAERGFEPAAFFLDTAITSSGIFDPPAAWADAVSVSVRAAGGLIVADEVQYGLGRPGSHFWGFERRGLRPDIVTMGKPVANGYPMGVVVANRALIEAFQAKFGFFSTFGGNAVAAAAGVSPCSRYSMAKGSWRMPWTPAATCAASWKPWQPAMNAWEEVRGAGLLFGVDVLGTDSPMAKRAQQIHRERAGVPASHPYRV